MARTTPPRPLDLEQLFPGLEAFTGTATRLHPRPGTPGLHDSHVGGRLLWPRDEPWPECDGPHLVSGTEALPPEPAVVAGTRPTFELLAELSRQVPGFGGIQTLGSETVAMVESVVREPVPSPMVPVAQLRSTDIPDLSCPTGADVVQVLWCPNLHRNGDYRGPAVTLRWRREAEVVDALSAAPRPTSESEEEYLPRGCVLHPEQVVEYPWWEDLPPELAERVSRWDDSREFGEESYFSLSQAPGWKVGGYASWEITDLIPMDCPRCRQRMDLLLTAASGELARDAWRPEEDAHLEPSRTDRTWRSANDPTGVHVGREGCLRIFVCLRCPGIPHRLFAV